nr:hypothetical protein Iba_chr11fCG6120 [Ipomoea batatas]
MLLLPPSAIDDPFNKDELFRSLVRYKPVDEWVFYFWLTAPFFLSRLPNLLSKGFFFFRLCGFTGEVFVFPLSCFSIEDTPFGWSLFSWTSAFGSGSSSCLGSLSGDESFSTNLKLSDVLSSASTESLASFSSLLLSSFSSLLVSLSFSSSSLAPMALSLGLSLELLAFWPKLLQASWSIPRSSSMLQPLYFGVPRSPEECFALRFLCPLETLSASCSRPLLRPEPPLDKRPQTLFLSGNFSNELRLPLHWKRLLVPLLTSLPAY